MNHALYSVHQLCGIACARKAIRVTSATVAAANVHWAEAVSVQENDGGAQEPLDGRQGASTVGCEYRPMAAQGRQQRRSGHSLL